MQATNKVYKYDCSQDDWHEFINAMQSRETFEVDEEMFYYWLEVLPPVYMGEFQQIDGDEVKCSFGFAEGRDYVTDFWSCGGRYFGKLSNRINTRG